MHNLTKQNHSFTRQYNNKPTLVLNNSLKSVSFRPIGAFPRNMANGLFAGKTSLIEPLLPLLPFDTTFLFTEKVDPNNNNNVNDDNLKSVFYLKTLCECKIFHFQSQSKHALV